MTTLELHEARELATGAIHTLALRLSVLPGTIEDDDGLTSVEKQTIAWTLVQATDAILKAFNSVDSERHHNQGRPI